MEDFRDVVPTQSIPTAFDEVSVRQLADFPQPSSPRSVALPQLASGSSFHSSQFHLFVMFILFNRGLEPHLVSVHATHTQDES